MRLGRRITCRNAARMIMRWHAHRWATVSKMRGNRWKFCRFIRRNFQAAASSPTKRRDKSACCRICWGMPSGCRLLLNGSSRRNGQVSYRWKECGRISARRNARVIKTGRCGMRLHRCRTASVRSISCSRATAGAACNRATARWAAAPILRAMCGTACRPAGWRNGRLWAT